MAVPHYVSDRVWNKQAGITIPRMLKTARSTCRGRGGGGGVSREEGGLVGNKSILFIQRLCVCIYVYMY